MKLVFAVIGDPANYRSVKYELDNCVEESITSFSVLKKCLKADKEIVIAGISLAKNCSDYTTCSSYVKEYIRSKGIDADEIIVSPNIFGKFKGKPDSFYAYSYFQILKILEKFDAQEDFEVILDTSHGINYMPLMIKDALMLAISAYSARNLREITFTIYNSDPVTQRRNSSGHAQNKETYKIHLINQLKITPLSALKYITSNILNKDKNNFNWNRIAKGQGAMSTFSELLFKIAKALDNGILLYLIELKKSSSYISKEKMLYFADILAKLEEVIKSVELRFSGDEVHIENKARVETAEAHALLYFASKFDNEVELNLDKLEEYAEVYLDEVSKAIVKNEIEKIKTNKDKIKEKTLLKNIIGMEAKGAEKRTLYARGGLPSAATYVELRNGAIYITYGDKFREIENNI